MRAQEELHAGAAAARADDRGTEFRGAYDRHEYGLYLAVENINHTRTETRSPQTNGIVERFHKTMLDEFYRLAFRKKLYSSINELQSDLEGIHLNSEPSAMEARIAIVTPVLDDWGSVRELVARIEAIFARMSMKYYFIAVNDGSSTSFTLEQEDWAAFRWLQAVEVIDLAVNLGHQRAIAVGLSWVVRRDDVDTVIVMDSDGEDRPEDIASLLEVGSRSPDYVVLAQRAQRSEGIVFRIGYVVYKALFGLLAGRIINFGNFCLLPIGAARRLVYMPELWNNLPAAIMRSRLRRVAVPTPRGRRYAGRSHMNLPALVTHGLSAMSVFSDLIFVRILLTAFSSGLVTVLALLTVLLIRMTTTLAIPGWTTTAFGDLIIILIQMVMIAVAATMMVLTTRSQRPVIPATDAHSFVMGRQRLVVAERSRTEMA